jgi:hypothetical protein
MKRKIFVFFLFWGPLLFNSCNRSGIPPETQQVTDLRAFAKLYGYVRFFHPSDEASKIDWDKFAIYGAGKVRQAKNTEELKTVLEELFKPVAPTMQLYSEGETPKDIFSMFPKDTAGLHVTAWQHLGKGSGSEYNLYKSMRIDEQSPDSDHLFQKYPHIGESIKKKLDGDIFCQIPLALYTGSTGKLGKDTNYPFPKLEKELDTIHLYDLPDNNVDIHVADIVITWNTMQHFFPYFDVSGTDWDAELTKALQAALTDSLDKPFFIAFKKMMAALNDGHGFTAWNRVSLGDLKLPCILDWIENNVVVTTTFDSNAFVPGDVIKTIDDVKAEDELRYQEDLISGSPQWKRVSALRYFGSSDTVTQAHVTLIRNGKEVNETFKRIYVAYPHHYDHTPIEKLPDDIYYIDLRQVSGAVLKEEEKILSKGSKNISAKGFIFDMRGYPTDAAKHLLCHLNDDTIHSAWFLIPEIIYPDHENIVGYDSLRWTLPPEYPRFRGKIVFLTNANAFSYGESIMETVDNYKLGTIVGEPTAGVNGDINPFRLPDGLSVTWTGLRVVNNDGSQVDIIGTKPTISVKRTIQGVKEGRDEVLEKAIALINGQ